MVSCTSHYPAEKYEGLYAGQALPPKEIPSKYGPRWLDTDDESAEFPSWQFCIRVSRQRWLREVDSEWTHRVLLARARDQSSVTRVADASDVDLAIRVLEREDLGRDEWHGVILVRNMREVGELRVHRSVSVLFISIRQ